MGREMTMKQFADSLTSRMLIGVALLQFVLFPVLFGGLLYIVKKGYETQFIDHARSDAYILASTITLSSEFLIIEDAALSGRISYAEFVDFNNNIVYRSEEKLFDNTLTEDFYFGGHDDDQYNIIIHTTD